MTIDELKELYQLWLVNLRRQAKNPDFTAKGERIFFEAFLTCKGLHNQIVDLESAGQ